VKSRSFFEQMKGRGVRVMQRPPTWPPSTPANTSRKTTSSSSIAWACASATKPTAAPWTKKSVPFDKLLQAVSLGNVEDEVLSSVAARLARLDKDASDADRANQVELSGGHTLRDLARGIVEALNIDATQDMPPAEADQRLRAQPSPCAPALAPAIGQ
jgi:type I restriction enzyme R subunit